jgi:hypothetical protein
LEWSRRHSDDTIARHVATCPECQAFITEAGDFFDPPRPGEADPAVNVAAEYERFRRSTQVAVMPPSRRFNAPLALAASVAVIAAAAALWQLAAQRRQYDELSRQLSAARQANAALTAAAKTKPELNVAIIDLFPKSMRERGTGEPIKLPAAPQESPVTLILNDVHRPILDHVEILDEAGKVVWSGGPLRRTPSGQVTLVLPAKFIAPGKYTLRASSAQSSPAQAGPAVEDYPFIVR